MALTIPMETVANHINHLRHAVPLPDQPPAWPERGLLGEVLRKMFTLAMEWKGTRSQGGRMMHHAQIAQRAFNTPLMVDPAKALAFLSGVGPASPGGKSASKSWKSTLLSKPQPLCLPAPLCSEMTLPSAISEMEHSRTLWWMALRSSKSPERWSIAARGSGNPRA